MTKYLIEYIKYDFILAKRLSDNQIKEIIESFKKGKNVEELSKYYNCTKLTITRNIKKVLGEKKYNELIISSKELYLNSSKDFNNNLLETKNEKHETINRNSEEEYIPITPFIEITPLNCEIESENQKDLSSIPISEIVFPKTVYILVDKKIELETKYLRDYPKWQFLAQEELKRKTIEIYYDLKIAKGSCGKEQKVIKVPNTSVFKTVAPILLSRGISRIVSSDKLIAL